MTITEYYRNFLSLYGCIVTALSSIPFISIILPKDYTKGLFPPIGPPQDILRIALPLIAVMVTFIVYQAKDSRLTHSKNRFKYLCFIAILALFSLTIYIGLSIRYVKTISNSVEPSVTVSVGHYPSDFVLNDDQLKGKTDEELLKSQGATESKVEANINKLYTPCSILCVRLALFLSYLCCFLPFIGIGSFLILFDLLDKTPSFHKRDFINVGSLITRLKNQQDALSSYLYKQLSSDTQKLVSEFTPNKTPSDELIDKLITDFNNFIEKSSQSDLQNQFAQIDLPKTRKLEKQFQTRLNRTFLEDAYPTEIQSHFN